MRIRDVASSWENTSSSAETLWVQRPSPLIEVWRTSPPVENGEHDPTPPQNHGIYTYQSTYNVKLQNCDSHTGRQTTCSKECEYASAMEIALSFCSPVGPQGSARSETRE